MSDEVRRSSSSEIAAVVEMPSNGPPPTIDGIAKKLDGLAKRFTQHVEEVRFERQLMKQRHDAVMNMLGDILARLP